MASQRLKRVDSLVRYSFGVIAAALLFVLMTVTCLDVIGRYVFERPLSGAFELSEIILSMIVYAALPLITLNKEHVTIDLLDRYIPEKAVGALRLLINLMTAAVLSLVTYALFQKTGQIFGSGMRTDTLFIPLGIVSALMTAATTMAAVIAVMLAFERAPSNAPSE